MFLRFALPGISTTTAGGGEFWRNDGMVEEEEDNRVNKSNKGERTEASPVCTGKGAWTGSDITPKRRKKVREGREQTPSRSSNAVGHACNVTPLIMVNLAL